MLKLICDLNKLELENIVFVMDADSSRSPTERIYKKNSHDDFSEFLIDMQTRESKPEKVLQMCLTEFQQRVHAKHRTLVQVQQTIDNAVFKTKQIK